MYAFFALTAVLLGFLGILLGLGRRQEIMANWPKHRFKPLIMLSAFLYKPADDSRSRWEFADANFREGILLQVTTTIKMVLEPLMNVFMVMGTSLDQSANNVESVKRTTEATAALFERMFAIFENRFVSTLHSMRMTFFRLNTAMQRIWAAAVNSIWQAYATTSAIMSTVDLIIKIVIIILVVLLLMLFFLFLFMWPFIPLILSVVGILVTAGAGAAAGGMAEAFCFGPEAMVCMANGTRKPIGAVQIGNVLADGGQVTGTMIFEGTPVRNLYGIPVTDHHIVYDASGVALFVSDHPDVGTYKVPKPDRVYCLNTSTHRIPIYAPDLAKSVLFADWEELEVEEDLEAWNRMVHTCLNPGMTHTPQQADLTNEAVFHPATQVETPHGPRDIASLRPGDFVLDAHKMPTRVTGIVRAEIPTQAAHGMSGAAWIQKTPRDAWTQVAAHRSYMNALAPPACISSKPWISLYTQAGTFRLEALGFAVRDFSDVGIDKMEDLTRHFVLGETD